MASGDVVVRVVNINPPATLAATLLARAGASTPNESTLVHVFDAATIWYMDYLCELRGYDGGGLTFVLPWAADTATTNETRWGIGIRRIADDAEDIDTSHTYDYNDVDDTAATTNAGELSYATITFTDGADMDSWADGEMAIVRVRRNASHANDNMTGNAHILVGALNGRET